MSSVASPEGLIHLGMDTSKNTIVVATLLPGEDSPVTDRIFNEEEAVRRLIGRFEDRSVLRAWYEAGPGGYDLYRLLASMGVACQVVAPSLIPKGGSDKVPARVHRAGHPGRERAGDPRPRRPPRIRHALPNRRPGHQRTRPSPPAEVPRGFRTVHPIGWTIWKGEIFAPSEEELLTRIQG